MGKSRVSITKEELEKLYYEKNRSASELAVLFNCTSTTIKNYLVKYNLRVKTQSEIFTGRKLSTVHREKVIKTLKNGNGKDNPNWKGGRTLKGRAKNTKYIMILVNGKYVPEHRYVMEQHLGRKLNKYEHVHHRNGNKHNNDISNLIIMSPSEHALLHGKSPSMRYRRSVAVREARANKFWSTRRVTNIEKSR